MNNRSSVLTLRRVAAEGERPPAPSGSPFTSSHKERGWYTRLGVSARLTARRSPGPDARFCGTLAPLTPDASVPRRLKNRLVCADH
ncbi:hypothetical protein EVAR_36407_1 [Eumeta japonica]|uniref:Uncharacterized protein n=1 Tax=Eumeta variegata TaxID=151549 RepID=A0A4C1VPT1_EUMVA|nr:hypothetical protein EVAR_36407_1 [Eumeta japonica]